MANLDSHGIFWGDGVAIRTTSLTLTLLFYCQFAQSFARQILHKNIFLQTKAKTKLLGTRFLDIVHFIILTLYSLGTNNYFFQQACVSDDFIISGSSIYEH